MKTMNLLKDIIPIS